MQIAEVEALLLNGAHFVRSDGGSQYVRPDVGLAGGFTPLESCSE